MTFGVCSKWKLAFTVIILAIIYYDAVIGLNRRNYGFFSQFKCFLNFCKGKGIFYIVEKGQDYY